MELIKLSEQSELKVGNKDVVVPGQVLATGMDYLPGMNAYRLGDKILASRLGAANIDGKIIKLMPLSGRYAPRRNDVIIAKVEDITMNGWRVNIFTAYSAFLNVKDATSDFIPKGADLRKYFDIGDLMVCKISEITSQMLIDLTMKGPGLRRLGAGRVFTVAANKVPRIIGKEGSMISLIKDKTGCQIMVGQNGIVWINGSDPNMELLATKAIQKIEAEAHISGLTDRIKEFLSKEGQQ